MRFLILAIALALTASSCLALRAPGRLDLPPAANHRDKWSTQPIAADIPVAVPSPAPPSPVPSPQPASSPCICNPPPLAGPTIAGEAEAIIKRLTPPDFASDGNCDYEHDPATDSPPVPAVSQGACICVPTAVATVSSTEQNPAAAPLHTTATLITTQLIISPTLAPLLVSTIYETIHQNIAVQEVQQTVNVVSTVLQPLAPPPSPSPTPSLLPAPAPKILLQVDSGISIIKHDTKGKTEQIQAVEEGFQVEFEPLKAGMGESTFTASWGKGAALSVMDCAFQLITSHEQTETASFHLEQAAPNSNPDVREHNNVRMECRRRPARTTTYTSESFSHTTRTKTNTFQGQTMTITETLGKAVTVTVTSTLPPEMT